MTIDSTFPSLLDTSDGQYRLALLITGDPRTAVRLVVHAAGVSNAAGSDAEAAMLRELLPKRAGYGRWQPAAAALQRASLDKEQARALLTLLAKRPPVERMIIGLHYLRGMTIAELPTLPSRRVPLDAGQVLARFHAATALALEQVPGDSGHAELIEIDQWLDGALAESEALDMRARTLADGETRLLRDGLLATRAFLPTALTGLFAVTPPAELAAQLQPKPGRKLRPRPRYLGRSAALAALIGGVLAVAALLAFLPSALSRSTRPASVVTAADVLDASIRRFETPPVTTGVLHERYRVEIEGATPQIIERWYDYATPHRLSMAVRNEAQNVANFAIRTNGRTLVEYRLSYGGSDLGGSATTKINYQLAANESDAAIAVLRSALMPIHVFQDVSNQPEISSLYLAQARMSETALLGRSSVSGREAYLLRYTTDQLPQEDAAGDTRQVLLAIDAQLSAVLEITVLSGGAGESIAARPWRAELIELVDSVEPSQFTFGDGDAATVVSGPRSLLAPSIPSLFTSLDEALRESQRGLLLPTEPPSDSRGLVMALRGDQRAARYGLMYEGEFQSLMLLPDPVFRDTELRWQGEERTTGGYRFRIAESLPQLNNAMLVQVYLATAPDNRVNIILQDAYSTDAEREQRIIELIGSLEPLTAENVEMLQRQLVPPPSAGGAATE